MKLKNYIRILPLAMAMLFGAINLKAQNDTIVVQAFTFATAIDSSIAFPSDTIRFEKILMRYKLRCPYTVQCGEWDYLSYTNLYKPLGVFDSVMHIAPSYVVNGSSPDSFSYMSTPSYTYSSYLDKHIVYDNVISFDSTILGNGSSSLTHPFDAAFKNGRSQYLFKSAELSAAGLTAGNISGLRFYVNNSGGDVTNLTIRIKNTIKDSITNLYYEDTALVTVYQTRTTSLSSGWQSIHFTNPFNWNGTSNLVFDISFTNDNGTATSIEVAGNNTTLPIGFSSAANDRSLFFKDVDYVEVPLQGFNSIDSAVTISFWCYGNPLYQPQNQSILEGIDSAGNRVINIHLPWSNGSVYFDAGNTGTAYDRIDKAANPQDYKGKWNHWAFIKNAKTGQMRIYLNGSTFILGAGKTKLMNNIVKFKIGSAGKGNSNYDGSIDDLTIWNTEISQINVKAWMFKDADNTHPNFSNLVYQYKMNDNSYIQTTEDVSGNNGQLIGVPESKLYKGSELFRNLQSTTYRPNVIFEQGVYNSHIETTVIVDSTQNPPVTVFAFNNPAALTTITDTLLAWPQYYTNVIYDSLGVATDSTLVLTDTTLYLVNTPYWDAPYEKTERFEIGRFITPYGNGLNLGNGFTWWYDVSDYRTLLHDTLRLSSGNWQELQDLQFLFIKGTPPRDPISIRNMWNGNFYLRASDSVETKRLYEKKILLDSAATTFKLKTRATGHGADNQNCAEFCQKIHSVKVDGVTKFSRVVWKDDCSLNPLYPQGGTWVYQRANWCPGDIVPDYDYELTPFVTPGDSVALDYDIQPYISVGGSPANYVTETQLVSYGPINFSLDAAITNIKSPSIEDIYKRMNPICDNAVITIKNTGSTTLTTLTISYGVDGGVPSTYIWNGNLAFDQSTDVTLPSISWTGSSPRFSATVSNPNGGVDQYAHNNSYYSSFTIPQQLPPSIVLEFKTNSQPIQNSYTLNDVTGNTLLSRSYLAANFIYSDTINLVNGCYTFRLIDTLSSNGIYGEDGLAWWANTAQGNGYMRIKDAITGALLVSFPTDFGKEIYKQFTVGYSITGIENKELSDVNVYPNPSDGNITIDMNFGNSKQVSVEIFDIAGKRIYQSSLQNVMDRKLKIDLSQNAPGMYHALIRYDNGVINKKFIIQR